MNDALKADFEQQLFCFIADLSEPYFKKITDSVSYSLTGGGKRLRPYMLIDSGLSAGGSTGYLFPLGRALEYIHTYSLIHDDLPAMDNDDFRRGKPSCHKKYGEAHAILTGDALLNLAYETMLSGSAKANNITQYLTACSIIAQAAGMGGMISGQVLDIESGADKTISEKVYKQIVGMKTGALFSAAIIGGATAAGVSKADQAHLQKYSEDFGYAFQLLDDLLDEGDGAMSALRFLSRAELILRIKEKAASAMTALQNLSYNADALKDYPALILRKLDAFIQS